MKQIMYVVHVAIGLLYVLKNVFMNIMNVLITKIICSILLYYFQLM